MFDYPMKMDENKKFAIFISVSGIEFFSVDLNWIDFEKHTEFDEVLNTGLVIVVTNPRPYNQNVKYVKIRS